MFSSINSEILYTDLDDPCTWVTEVQEQTDQHIMNLVFKDRFP